MEKKIFNPCSAIIAAPEPSGKKKNAPVTPAPITCGQESNHLHTPGTQDGRRYCEHHYLYLAQKRKDFDSKK